MLLETFYDATRFRGTCYRAANWIHVGHTQGCGKLDVHHRSALPVKHILLKPIHPAGAPFSSADPRTPPSERLRLIALATGYPAPH